MRHAKHWFAAEARNWPLAAYELDELEEGFDDVVRLHPTHKDAPAAPQDLVPRMMAPAVKLAREAVDHHDLQAFSSSTASSGPPRIRSRTGGSTPRASERDQA